jgi:indolepyruvate ferredoxin oxidoreductase alpha subunit
MTGNEAAARGAYEAGLKVGAAYPGTPSTEIFENLPQYKDALYCEWAPNEKVATEVAYGASMAGVRSMCAMKHVGLNVAADPMFTAAYNGVGGGFVIVSADDPSMHSSQNEQDNRYYAKAAKMAMVEPSDSQECKDFMKAAFDVSEQFDIPVLFRTTTRVCHSKSLVSSESAPRPRCCPTSATCASSSARRPTPKLNHPLVEEKLRDAGGVRQHLRPQPHGDQRHQGRRHHGLHRLSVRQGSLPGGHLLPEAGLTFPLPMDLIREFASKVEKLYIVEELEPFMEDADQGRRHPLRGQGSTSGRTCMSSTPAAAKSACSASKPKITPSTRAWSRPPALCPGCPHRGFFYTMSKGKDFVICGDIGCYTLGCAAPLNAMDSVSAWAAASPPPWAWPRPLSRPASPTRRCSASWATPPSSTAA